MLDLWPMTTKFTKGRVNMWVYLSTGHIDNLKNFILVIIGAQWLSVYRELESQLIEHRS